MSDFGCPISDLNRYRTLLLLRSSTSSEIKTSEIENLK